MPRKQSQAFEDMQEPNGDAVFRRLKELGLPPEAVRESVREGYQRGDFVTDSHPVNYQGMVVWGEITGAFRGRMMVEGWAKNDEDCVPRIVSPDGRVVVVPVRGNSNTGVRNAHEQLSTRRPRGRAGVRIVRVNTQYALQLEEQGRERDFVPALDGTWFLLYNREEDIVRMEVSYAKAISASGALLEWVERLILPDLDLLDFPTDRQGRDDGTPPEVDFVVTRRAS
jgi:hypothetical protein